MNGERVLTTDSLLTMLNKVQNIEVSDTTGDEERTKSWLKNFIKHIAWAEKNQNTNTGHQIMF